jgi:hypothetical protein
MISTWSILLNIVASIRWTYRSIIKKKPHEIALMWFRELIRLAAFHITNR